MNETFEPASIDWRSCAPSGYECGTLDVPLDYRSPEGRTMTLSLKRRPADDQSDRIGSLFYNPGGPGASGVESLPGIVNEFSEHVRRTFDIVSWDPRGVGESDPIECDDGIFDLYREDLDEVNPSEGVEEASRAAADQCEARSGDVLPFVGTIDVARDLDTLRRAVGDEKLTYLGASYGTLIGLVYAEMFPTDIRAMILDGVVDPTVESLTANLLQSKAVDKAIGEFVDWCRNAETCALMPDPAGALDELQRKAEAGELRGQVRGETITLSPTLSALAVVTATYDESIWPTLARGVRRALDGDASQIARIADSYVSLASLGANSAINCLDAPRPTKEEIDELVERAAREAPRVGPFNANSGRVCEHWRVEPKPIDTELDVEGAPPIMVWGTTGDNATPYENAVHVSTLLPGARLVTLEAKRHAALGANACVERLQSAYLTDLELPPDGTRC